MLRIFSSINIESKQSLPLIRYRMENSDILFLLVVIFLFFLVIMSGCGEQKECKTGTDCSLRECYNADCIDSACSYSLVPSCCGNDVCEQNAGENSCICQDCGVCNGTLSYEDKDTAELRETSYLRYRCIDDECVLDSERSETPFFTEQPLSYFNLELTSTIEQPFDVSKSNLKIRFKLANADPLLIFPVSFTGIKILDYENKILGEKDLEKSLDAIGSSFEEELAIPYGTRLSDGTDVLEQETTIKLRVSYVYSYQEQTDTSEDGTPIYSSSSPKIETFEYQFSDKVIFVNPDAKK